MSFETFLGVVVIAIIILGGIYMYDRFVLQKSEFENSELEKMIREQNAHFEKMKDINNSLEELREKIQKREQENLEKQVYNDYCNYNNETIRSIKQLVVTGDAVLDAVLSQKKIVADEKHVAISFDVRVIDKIQLNDVDKVSLFGNILDNAIEAAENSKDKGFVQFQLIQKETQYIIICRNSKNASIELQLESMKTTKEDKGNHGRGICIIKNIVNQNHGICILQDEGSVFELKIML